MGKQSGLLMYGVVLVFTERKKFYENVSISQGEGKHNLAMLDSSIDQLLKLQSRQESIVYNKKICVSSVGGFFEINLDKRKLKTPGGKLFSVPNEALAIAVATEWDAQKDTLKFFTMHLVRH